MGSGTRLMIGFTFAVFLVVGAIVSLATGSWWFLILALGVHAIGTVVVLLAVGIRLTEQDKPDPVTEARLAEEPDENDRPHPAS
jgi:hypothetical protein